MTQPSDIFAVHLPCIVSVTGLKKSGKTTVVEALLAELTSRGKRVSSLKKMEHGALDLDPQGTDTRSHADAGAEVVLALLGRETVRFERVSVPPSLQSIAAHLPRGTDFLVCEGIVDPAAPQAIVVCLQKSSDWEETMRVRKIREGQVLAVSGVAAGGIALGDTLSPDGIPMFDVGDQRQRSALADLVIKKACPDVES
jgi:molybdopterin-guanine dinucleotide biosynthesis protein MobB